MIKVLASTKKSQGKRKNDFSFVPEDELVVFGTECSGEAIDGQCGCRRSMTGMESRLATTTLKVIEIDLTGEQYERLVLKTLRDAGFGDLPGIEEQAMRDARGLLDVVNHFPVGSILEKRGNKFVVRATR